MEELWYVFATEESVAARVASVVVMVVELSSAGKRFSIHLLMRAGFMIVIALGKY